MREIGPKREQPLNAPKLMQMLCSVFPAFNDVTTYHNRKVFVCKKVQLLVADLARAVAPMDDAWKW
jgi:hypothetical protein